MTIALAMLAVLHVSAQQKVEVKGGEKQDPPKQEQNPRKDGKAPAKNPKLKGTIFFERTKYNYDRIEEESGIQYTTFAFANIGKGDLQVLDVHASCGCTQPQWSKAVIKTNETGYIKVGFSPKGQAGRFEKSLTVTTNGDPERVYLEISGEVVGSTQEWHIKTPQVQGNTRVTSNLLSFRRPVMDTRPDSLLFNIFNSSKNVVQIMSIQSPQYIVARPVKNTLQPGTGTNIWLHYMPNAGAKYGENEDEIVVRTTDDSIPEKRFILKMNMEQDFAALAADQRKKPAGLKIAEPVKDFGEIYLGEVVQHEFLVTNTGKSDLIIRRAYGSCGCTVASIPAAPIGKGKTGKIIVTLNAKNLVDHVTKEITVIANDPQHPVTKLTVKANVVDPSRK